MTSKVMTFKDLYAQLYRVFGDFVRERHATEELCAVHLPGGHPFPVLIGLRHLGRVVEARVTVAPEVEVYSPGLCQWLLRESEWLRPAVGHFAIVGRAEAVVRHTEFADGLTDDQLFFVVMVLSEKARATLATLSEIGGAGPPP